MYYPGTFSNVYLAKMNKIPDELCALKHIIPTSGPGRIENELKCLQDIGWVEKVTFQQHKKQKLTCVTYITLIHELQCFTQYYYLLHQFQEVAVGLIS